MKQLTGRFLRLFLFAFATFALSSSFGIAAAQEAPVTLNLWMFLDGTDFLPSVVEAFEAQYPHITVQLTDVPEGEYGTKIDTAFLAGAPPDIGFPLVDRWLEADYFLPLDEALAAQGISVDEFNPGAISRNCMKGGSVYCLGTYTGGTALFYNKDMFDAAGIPYPSSTEPLTVDQYAEIARQLAVPSDNIEERIWGGNGPRPNWFDERHYFSEDGRTAEGYLNSEANARAFQVIADLYKSGTVLTTADISLVEPQDLMATGQLAMAVGDTVTLQPLLEASNIRWGAAPPPVLNAGDEPWVYTGSDELGVFRGTAHPEEAILFVVFWGSEGNRMRAEADGLPLNMRIAEELNWAGDSEGRQEMLAALQLSRPSLGVPDRFPVVINPLVEAIDGLMIEDGLSAQEALDETAPIVQDNLDQAWATWDAIQPIA